MKSKIILIAILMSVTFAGLCQNGNENGNGNGNNKASIVAVPVSPTPLSLTTNTTATLQSTLNLTQNKLYPIAPNAAELGRFSAVQVGLFTGTAQYSIPIYEFKTPNLTLPISLDYSSNGLVVDKVGSWVGFDWALNVGGVINRYRKGKVDRPGTRPGYPYNWNTMTATQKKSYLDNDLSFGDNDLEPDEFTYSFSNYNGKFVFDELGKPVLIPYSNLKIETNTSGGAYTFFKITTPEGISYMFENTGSTLPIDEPAYISSWYLTQISHPSGDIISFNYTTCNMNQFFGVVQSATAVIQKEGIDTGQTTPEMTEKVNTVNISTLFLDKITFQGCGSIVFERKKRKDSYQDYRLRKITVKDNLNNPIKQFVFFHQFPLRSQYYQSKSTLDITESNETEHNYRMFLDSLQFQDRDSSRVCSYKFYYNNLTELPARFSYSQDHWGYFNGKYNNDFAVRSETVGFQYLFNDLIYSDADRSPDSNYSRKGMLQKIVFPTGGYTTIDYEANSNEAGNVFGGCRVLRTKTYKSTTGTPEIKKYNYSGVQSLIYYKYFNDYWLHYSNEYCQLSYSYKFGVLSSNSYYSQSICGLYHVIYGRVEALLGENGENGKEIHLFNIDFDLSQGPLNGNPIYPLVLSNTGWKAGLLASNYLQNNSFSGEVWKKELSYNFNETRNRKTINCLAVEKFTTSQCLIADDSYLLSSYNVVPYTLSSVWYYVDQETITQNQSGKNISTATSYIYDINSKGHSLLSKESFVATDGTVVEKRYYYPHDYNAVENFSTLIRKWIIANPVDVRTYRGTKLVDGEQNQYNDNGQLTDIYKLESSNGTDIAFNQAKPFSFPHKHKLEYKANNCINIETPENEVKSYYLWDTSGKYLMAKITGNTVDWDNISPYNNLDYSTLSRDLWTNLKSVSGNAFITTYSYKSLVGLTSQTDPAGRTTYYDYDDFGRLKLTKDLQGNIVKKMEYHYAGQN